MATKKITELTELTTPNASDVLAIVDLGADITKKITTSNLLQSKQDLLESGTNIKTINSTSLLGSGDVAVQETLVSGTNIKTINSTSLLGSGDISISANPSGGAGSIQFSDGSAFASDSNLFWDNTNKRLGVGTSSPNDRIEVNGNIRVGASSFLYSSASGGAVTAGLLFSSSTPKVSVYTNSAERVIFGASTIATIKGSGSTSATTSLLVQNSSGTDLFKVRDDGWVLASILSAGTYRDFSTLISSGGKFNVNTINNYLYSQFANNVFGGSNADADASAVMTIKSTTKGFLPPRMTTTQKNAISSPASGLMVYDTTTNKLCCYNGTSWNDLF